MEHVRVYADHVGGVGRADVHHALQRLFPELVRDRHGPEVDPEAHSLGQLDEDELVPPVGVARLRKPGLDVSAHSVAPRFPL